MTTKRVGQGKRRSAATAATKRKEQKAEQEMLLEEMRANREAIRRRTGHAFDVLEALDEARKELL